MEPVAVSGVTRTSNASRNTANMYLLVSVLVCLGAGLAQGQQLSGARGIARAYAQTHGADGTPQYTPQPKYPSPNSDVPSYSVPQERSRDYVTPIPIIRFEKEQAIDGSYKSSYETGNHIIAEETGFIKNAGVENEEALVQHGSYSYTAPDGTLITVTYTADEGGFRAEGAHLPTPPPVSAEVQRGLDIIYEQIRLQAEQEDREQRLGKGSVEDNAVPENYPTQRRIKL